MTFWTGIEWLLPVNHNYKKSIKVYAHHFSKVGSIAIMFLNEFGKVELGIKKNPIFFYYRHFISSFLK